MTNKEGAKVRVGRAQGRKRRNGSESPTDERAARRARSFARDRDERARGPRTRTTSRRKCSEMATAAVAAVALRQS